VAQATAVIGPSNYEVSLVAAQHLLKADEGLGAGGKDLGLAPHEILCAALGAWTANTLMHAARTDWRLRSVHVDVHLELHGEDRAVTRRLRLEGDLDQAQRARLADIAERTPVTLTLKQGVTITTTLESQLDRSMPGFDRCAVHPALARLYTRGLLNHRIMRSDPRHGNRPGYDAE
jgi:putative redox protein